jgi:hypothetical protein
MKRGGREGTELERGSRYGATGLLPLHSSTLHASQLILL